MDAETFAKREWPRHSRLGVAKSVVADFVSKRPHDRIGLVGFAGEAQTLCPLTLDHGILREMLDAADHETIPVNGTAIGDALMNSIRRLDRSKAPSKVVVLLTDGVHNAGSVHPAQAAAVAKTLGVRIHAIGVGKRSGTQLRPVDLPAGSFGKHIRDIKMLRHSIQFPAYASANFYLDCFLPIKVNAAGDNPLRSLHFVFENRGFLLCSYDCSTV